MAQHVYDSNGNYKGKILSEEEHQNNQPGCFHYVLGAPIVLLAVDWPAWICWTLAIVWWIAAFALRDRL